jgi:gamma-glutamyltranspeptidase/glutathione hydrolase
MRLAHELAVMAEQVSARGVNGVVAAAAPLAAQAGVAAIRGGGNAFDAVVAAALAETVLLPPKCGLGGDLIAIALHAGAREPISLIAVGGAPAGLAGVARSGAWRDVGPNSVGPPAAGAGYAALAGCGRLGRDALAAPAIALAVDGFAWAQVASRLSEQSIELVGEMNPGGTVYFPDGSPIAPGSVVRLPGLAAALAEWVERGPALLEGPLGAAIADAVGSRGGVLAADDLSAVTAEWLACASADVGDRRVWATPAPTHGASLLEAVADWSKRPPGAGGVHAAVMDAIARQRQALGDPGGTSIVSAADADGNAVLVIHSNSYPRFGSGIVVPGYDLVLANRAGRGFTPIEGHPNFPQAGRRPATTLHAWAVASPTGAVGWIGGTPGGVNQMPWNAQTVAQLLSGEERPGVLVAGPLWEWMPDDDGVRVEAGFDDDGMQALTAAAPRLVKAPRWGCKSARQVLRLPQAGEAFEAAADPRTVGLALAV